MVVAARASTPVPADTQETHTLTQVHFISQLARNMHSRQTEVGRALRYSGRNINIPATTYLSKSGAASVKLAPTSVPKARDRSPYALCVLPTSDCPLDRTNETLKVSSCKVKVVLVVYAVSWTTCWQPQQAAGCTCCVSVNPTNFETVPLLQSALHLFFFSIPTFTCYRRSLA